MYGDFPETNPLALPTPGPTPDPSTPIYGPISGSIAHDSDDGGSETYQGPTVTGDVMLEVTFENPFAPNESHWNYGILFDDTSPARRLTTGSRSAASLAAIGSIAVERDLMRRVGADAPRS